MSHPVLRHELATREELLYRPISEERGAEKLCWKGREGWGTMEEPVQSEEVSKVSM